MKQRNKFSLLNRIRSFKFAVEGVKLLFKTEHNSWIHLSVTIIVIALGVFFHLSSTEWCLIIFSIGFVFITEIINTSVEYLTDIVSPSINENAKKVKDLAAASVLFATLVAIIVGFIIFFPKIIAIF